MAGISTNIYCQFQSLLCWIMVCKYSTAKSPEGMFLCFNPCYVGLWSVRSKRMMCIPLIHLFQSLLCWIMVCKSSSRSTLLTMSSSFNPCYVGLWSVRPLNPTYNLTPYKFQSLLCWIMVCKSAPPPCFWRCKPVSILVMLDYGL